MVYTYHMNGRNINIKNTTMKNKDIIDIIENGNINLVEMSIDPNRFGENLMDQHFMNESIVLKMDNIDVVIDFNLFISVTLSNSMGDNYITENFNEIEKMNIDLDITNVDTINIQSSLVLDSELKSKLTKLIKNFLI